MGKNNTKVDLFPRIEAVKDAILSGNSSLEDLRELAHKRNWSVSDRTLQNYRKTAYSELCACLDVDRRTKFIEAVAKLEKLLSIAFKMNNVRDALAVQKELNRLWNLYSE